MRETIPFAWYEQSAAFLQERLALAGYTERPQIAIVLGSGLGPFADELADAVSIPYTEIPHFPHSTVASHAGKLLCGTVGGCPVLALAGRFHFYEGYSFAQAAYYVRVLRLLGVKTLILTNAAGGINETFRVGDLMLITDHIKFFTDSPVRGPEMPAFGERFFDLSNVYDKACRSLVKDCAAKLSIPLREGVYAFMPGPQFETPAEIRMLRTLGADAVGMSTVPEAITAAQCGLQTLGISCITNLAAGMLDQPVSDQEVVEAAKLYGSRFTALLREILTVFASK